MPAKPRTVFIISDGTGITAETFSHSILAQFETPFKQIRLPFIDTIDKAYQAAREIEDCAKQSGLAPIVFTTLVNPEINEIALNDGKDTTDGQAAKSVTFDLAITGTQVDPSLTQVTTTAN